MSKSIKSSLSNLKAGLSLMAEAVNDLAIMVNGDGTAPIVSRPMRRTRGKAMQSHGTKRLHGTKRVKAFSLMRKLRAWRITNKLSQAEMAARVGFTTAQSTAWGHWERERTCPTVMHFAIVQEFATRENVS